MNKKAFIPAFGDWDYYYYNNSTTDGFPITQYFESSFNHHLQYHPQQDLVNGGHEQEDLYVVGTGLDLYESDIANHYQNLHCNVVSPTPTKFHVQNYQNVEKHQKKKMKVSQEHWACSPLKELSPTIKNNKKTQHFKPAKKVVDEDLYKISPHQLQIKPQRVHCSSHSLNLWPSTWPVSLAPCDSH